jgi:hypothetical protein
MIQIISKENISAVFGSLEKKSFCGYFIILETPRKTISEVYERSPNAFEEFSWFIETKDELYDLGFKLKLNSNIKLLKFSSSKCDIYEVYGVDGNAILNKIAYLQDINDVGKVELSNMERLQRSKDLQGITLR